MCYVYLQIENILENLVTVLLWFVMTFVGIGQGFSNFFLATQISASKSYATQTEENVNLPKLVKGMSLLSFIEF